MTTITAESSRALLARYDEDRIPDADGWIKWGGGTCPVDPEALVECRYRDMDISDEAPARDFSWTHPWSSDEGDTPAQDIIAYRVTGDVTPRSNICSASPDLMDHLRATLDREAKLLARHGGLSVTHQKVIATANEQFHRANKLQAERDAALAALEKIASADEVTLMCDPLGSRRIARAALAKEASE